MHVVDSTKKFTFRSGTFVVQKNVWTNHTTTTLLFVLSSYLQ